MVGIARHAPSARLHEKGDASQRSSNPSELPHQNAAQALTAKNLLPVGHVITPNDLEWMYSKQPADAISMEQIVGMETRRALRPGSPIQYTDLRTRPYVRTRDLVTVKARQGGIVVKRTMRSLGTGGLGEAVELVTLDGKDRFTARVTGFHETEFLETQPEQSR
jgi:flagella basal body P-ring formation protein FlgA